MNLFEAKARIIGISLKMSVSFTCMLLHLFRKLIKAVTEARSYVLTSQLLGIERLRSSFAMFLKRFVGEFCQFVSRPCEDFVPKTLRFQLGQQPFSEFVLLFLRELDCLGERFFKELGHSVEFKSVYRCAPIGLTPCAYAAGQRGAVCASFHGPCHRRSASFTRLLGRFLGHLAPE